MASATPALSQHLIPLTRGLTLAAVPDGAAYPHW